MFYESSNYVYDFKVFKTIKHFGNSINKQKIEIHEANKKKDDLLKYILSFSNKTKQEIR